MPTVTRLNQITTQMKSLWTYGDKDFGYTFEVNEKHNTQYPYMMINPPNSEMPEIYGGWESYDFEIDFFDTYKTANRKAVALDKEWDNLQDLVLEWFDNLMNVYNNPGGPDVNIYFLEETLTFERVKEVANDRLVQIKIFFTLRAVTRCMLGNVPMTDYPNKISNLAMWLSADSNVVFNTTTGRISSWGDRSGNSNDVQQITAASRPKRIDYGGASEKTRISFSGDEFFETVNNSPIGTDFSAFLIAKSQPVTPSFTNTYSTHMQGTTDRVDIGNPQDGGGNNIYSFTNGAGNDTAFSVSVWSNIDPTQVPRGWVDKRNSSSVKEYSFYTLQNSGYIFVKLFDSSGNYLQARVTTSAIASGGEWKNYLFTYDGSNSEDGINIYINGVQSADSRNMQGAYAGMSATASALEIGNGNGNSYYGDVDEVTIFNKELSEPEVTEIYNLGNPTDINTSTVKNDCIGWWRMGDGATYPTIPDLALATTSPNDGAMTNMEASDIRKYAPNSEKSTYLSYESGNAKIFIGSSSERVYCQVSDSAQATGEWNARNIWDADSSEYVMVGLRLDSTTEYLTLYGNTGEMTGVMEDYDPTQTYNSAKLQIGKGSYLGNLAGGDIQEVILYTRAITDLEVTRIKNYLNNKYKIY